MLNRQQQRFQFDPNYSCSDYIEGRPNRRACSGSWLVARVIIAQRIFSGWLILLSCAHDRATHRRLVIGGMSATRSSDWRVSSSSSFVPSAFYLIHTIPCNRVAILFLLWINFRANVRTDFIAVESAILDASVKGHILIGEPSLSCSILSFSFDIRGWKKLEKIQRQLLKCVCEISMNFIWKKNRREDEAKRKIE